MSETNTAPQVAIVDFGLGNLFSVQRACEQAGLSAAITADKRDILGAKAVILPGVGAFGDAMAALRRLDLPAVLAEVAAMGKPLMGICLGMQLLMSESQEFGRHRGLGLVEGEVVRLQNADLGPRRLKVPQVGWNRLRPAAPWQDTPLKGLSPGEFMYFVHSFYVRPAEQTVVLAATTYGPVEFCSSLKRGSIFACQFHPERSGPAGLLVYRGLASSLGESDGCAHGRI
jgi:glutamine amidotransferase